LSDRLLDHKEVKLRILDTSVGRWMAIVMTTALGLMTMRTQSDFALGALVAVAAGWGLLAINDVVSGTPNRRAGGVSFLIVVALMLFYGFGPWSDRQLRSEIVPDVGYDTTKMIRYDKTKTTRASELSGLFLRNRFLFDPFPQRARLTTYDAQGTEMTDVVFRSSSRLDNDFYWRFDDVMAPFRFPGQDHRTPCAYFASDQVFDVYLDGAHVLLALAVGGLASLIAPAIVQGLSASSR